MNNSHIKALQVKEPDVRGSRLQNRRFQDVIDLVRSGKVDLHQKISHTFPLEQAEEAFAFALSGDPSIRKIVLVNETPDR